MNTPNEDETWAGALETDDYSWIDEESDELVTERDAELLDENYGDPGYHARYTEQAADAEYRRQSDPFSYSRWEDFR